MYIFKFSIVVITFYYFRVRTTNGWIWYTTNIEIELRSRP